MLVNTAGSWTGIVALAVSIFTAVFPYTQYHKVTVDSVHVHSDPCVCECKDSSPIYAYVYLSISVGLSALLIGILVGILLGRSCVAPRQVTGAGKGVWKKGV